MRISRGSRKVRQRLVPPARVIEEHAERVQGIAGQEVVGAKHALSDTERALEQLLRVAIPLLLVVELAEVVEIGRDLRVIGAERLLANAEGLGQGLAFGVLLLPYIELGEVVERAAERRMREAKRLFGNRQRLAIEGLGGIEVVLVEVEVGGGPSSVSATLGCFGPRARRRISRACV